MLFVVNNLHYLQINTTVHDIDTRCKNQLHIPLVRLPAIQRDIIFFPIKVFNKLSPHISKLK
jgi:hypothetical protein